MNTERPSALIPMPDTFSLGTDEANARIQAAYDAAFEQYTKTLAELQGEVERPHREALNLALQFLISSLTTQLRYRSKDYQLNLQAAYAKRVA